MDLSFTEDQIALRDLARQILTGHVTGDRLKEIEAEPDRIDRTLWSELARAGFLEIEGFVEACIAFEEQGRAVAPVPLWSTLVARRFVGNRELPQDAMVTIALPDGDTADIPAVHVAQWIVAPKEDGLILVDPSSVPIDVATSTTGDPIGRASMSDLAGEPLDGDPTDLLHRATVALCDVQTDAAEAVRNP